jgi:hypothetical protein
MTEKFLHYGHIYLKTLKYGIPASIIAWNIKPLRNGSDIINSNHTLAGRIGCHLAVATLNTYTGTIAGLIYPISLPLRTLDIAEKMYPDAFKPLKNMAK